MMFKKRTAVVTMELNAVVDARYSRAYMQTNKKEAMVVRTGNLRRVSTCEKYFENGKSHPEDVLVSVQSKTSSVKVLHLVQKPTQCVLMLPTGLIGKL